MRVVIVGCGRMGRERAKAASSLGVETILLFDEDRNRAVHLEAECDRGTAVLDLTTVIQERPDAIFICTPPFCRGFVEKRAIELGIPFFAEKPIGVSADQVHTVRNNLHQRNVLNAVGYMNRYRNSVAHARVVLQSRTVIGITAHWIGRAYAVPWWAVHEQSGGPFNEQGTHLIDLFRYIGGPIQALYASRTPNTIESTVVAVLRLMEGGLGTLLYSCEAKEKDILVSIETTDGVLILRGWDLTLVQNTIDGTYPEAESEPIFVKETHAFLQAVSTGNKNFILSDFADAYETQMAMDELAKIMQCNSQFAVVR